MNSLAAGKKEMNIRQFKSEIDDWQKKKKDWEKYVAEHTQELENSKPPALQINIESKDKRFRFTYDPVQCTGIDINSSTRKNPKERDGGWYHSGDIQIPLEMLDKFIQSLSEFK